MARHRASRPGFASAVLNWILGVIGWVAEEVRWWAGPWKAWDQMVADLLCVGIAGNAIASWWNWKTG